MLQHVPCRIPVKEKWYGNRNIHNLIFDILLSFLAPRHNITDGKYLNWESEIGKIFLHGGFNYSGGDLVVPRQGIYRLFLQITYESKTCNGQRLELKNDVMVFHDNYLKDVSLLQSYDTVNCSMGRWKKSLYASGLFELEANSKLHVTSSKPDHIMKNEKLTFFGAEFVSVFWSDGSIHQSLTLKILHLQLCGILQEDTSVVFWCPFTFSVHEKCNQPKNLQQQEATGTCSTAGLLYPIKFISCFCLYLNRKSSQRHKAAWTVIKYWYRILKNVFIFLLTSLALVIPQPFIIIDTVSSINYIS